MKFYDTTCQECPFHQTAGSYTLSTTRYCSGFPGRKPKRFPRSAPKFKPPKWCPRRLSLLFAASLASRMKKASGWNFFCVRITEDTLAR